MSQLPLTREAQELHEIGNLASYAATAANTRGRVHHEEKHPYRTCFQRDRDRVIHSAAFRRLEAKTQVFLGQENDYYRTRLTHTIEVSQIARTMARALGVNEDLAEAAALAHDLGHPPYGHCGEMVLNELMAKYGGFEHNRHSLRVVDYLEHPYPGFRGLNLTYETRLCLAKHKTRYDKALPTSEFECPHGPIESQIVDLADTIAYNSHDLDDALSCGLIDENDLRQVNLYQKLKDKVHEQFPQAHQIARQLRCAKGIIDILVGGALEHTAGNLVKIKPQSLHDVLHAKAAIVELPATLGQELTDLEMFLAQRVYQHPTVARAAKLARDEITLLFDTYLADLTLLPQRYQQRLDEQSPQRVVCDYLAGMTDRFCHQFVASIKKNRKNTPKD